MANLILIHNHLLIFSDSNTIYKSTINGIFKKLFYKIISKHYF